MTLNLLNASLIAATAHHAAAISKMVIAMSIIQSAPTNIERAATWQTYVFVGYVFLLLFTLVGTVLLYKAGNAYQEAVKADADAKSAASNAIAETAKKDAAEANAKAAQADLGAAKANEGLAKSNEEIARLTKEAEALRAEAENAKANIVIAQADAAKATEGAAKAGVEVANLQVVVANAETRRAEAERALLEVQERLKDRHLTTEQRARLLELLKANPKGAINVSCIAGSSAEPCNFADEIVAVLTEAGWQVDFTGRGMIMVGGTPVGVFIQVHNAAKAPIRAEVLQKALGAIDVEAGGVVSETMQEGTVNLVVGAKPQPR